MSHVDEGLIHAWLEDQLPPHEAERVARLVKTDAAWRAAAAEARGLIAATARVIGALDSAPSAVGVGVTTRTGRTRRGVSWARRPWMRVAAAIVLVAGISGVLFTGGNDVTVSSLPVKDEAQKETKSAAEAPPAAEQSAPSAQRRAPQVAQVQVRRDSLTAAERGGAGNAVAAAPPPATAATANEATSAAKSLASVATGVSGITGASGTTGTTGAADAVADIRGVAGGRGGRGGGRGGGLAGRVTDASTGLAPQAFARNDLAKVIAVPDSVFRGCWVTVDTVRRETRQAAESAGIESLLLRFTPPVVTDLGGARSTPVSASAAPPQAGAISALRPAPARARMQNATAHMKDDSTVVAEWLNPDRSSTQLTFRSRGDTLRGTTNTIAGGLVTAGPSLIAVRALCSQ